MTEEQRYAAVQADVKRLLDQAANDKSSGGMVGFGATWLAAEMFMRNEETHQRHEDKDHGKDTIILPLV